MKFLEYTPLARVNAFLSYVNLGDSLLKGSLEAYSCKTQRLPSLHAHVFFTRSTVKFLLRLLCKHTSKAALCCLQLISSKAAGVDKKYSRNLDQEVIESLASSPCSLSSSPLGPLSSLASRRTFIYLILAMSNVYPDYDFSFLRPNSFAKDKSLEAAKLKISNYLLETSKVWASEFGEDAPFYDCTWEAIDEVIGLEDCDVYSYSPEAEEDPLWERGMIWSFSYFFYNRKLKRILCFSCRCLSKLAVDEDSLDEILSEEEGDYLQGMDME